MQQICVNTQNLNNKIYVLVWFLSDPSVFLGKGFMLNINNIF